MAIYLGLSFALLEASWEDTRDSRLNSFGTVSPLGGTAKAKEKARREWILDNVFHTDVHTQARMCPPPHICSCVWIPEP